MKLFAAQNRKEQATALALIETVAAAMAALWLDASLKSFVPFALSAFAAPLLLLQTRDSRAHGIRMARRLGNWSHGGSVCRNLAAVPLVFLGPLLIRLWATVASLVRDFRGCLVAFPSNWWRLVSQVDFTIFPDTIPGFRSRFTETSPFLHDSWDVRARLENMRWSIRTCKPPWYIELPMGTLTSALVFLPAWLYRWTLKSTFWLYLPLLWVLEPARYDRGRLETRLQVILDNRIALLLSGLVLGFGLLKIRIWQIQVELSAWWSETTLGRFFELYVVPDSMPVWQYVSIVNSIFSLALYLVARSALQSRELESPWPDSAVNIAVQWMTACRRLMTLYVTLVLVMITVKRGFPPLGPLLPP